MNSVSMNSQRRRHCTMSACVLALVLGLAGCAPASGPPPTRAEAGQRALADAVTAAPTGEREPMPVALNQGDPRLQHASLRALLHNLLDDGDPPRFKDPQWPIVCGEQSTVTLDGRTLAGGEPVPDQDFMLDFALDGACPLGDGGPLLYGRLRMLVVHDDIDGLVPLALMPR
jgi:hypothetical protein